MAEKKSLVGKTELIDMVHEIAGGTKKDAGKYIDAVTEAIQKAVASGNKVQLIGFGGFEVRERSARKGRHPQSGEEIDIAASKVPAFKPGKEFKDSIPQ